MRTQLNFENVEVRISDKELRTPGATGIDVEFIEAEEIDYDDLVADARLTRMSPYTRLYIQALFGGDVDEANYEASRLVQNFSKPPAWALDVHHACRVAPA